MRLKAIEEAKAVLDSSINLIWSQELNWDQASIGDLARTVSGQIDPRIEPYANLPHINGEAIESGTCRLLKYRLAKEDEITSGKYHFPPNSVLYSKIRPYLRKAVFVSFEGVCSADIYAFEEISEHLEPRFFMYSLVSPRFTEYANTLSGRTRMPKLNQTQLFSFQLSYPKRDEQRRIVAYLDELKERLDTLKRLQAETAAELDALLPSILERAFKGELFASPNFAEAFGLTQRQLILLEMLMCISNRKDGERQSVNITPLMKYAFVYGKEGVGVEQWYEFEPYLYGPYSKVLYQDLDVLQNAGLVRRRVRRRTRNYRGAVNVTFVSEKAAEISNLLSNLSPAVKAEVHAVVEKYRHLKLNEFLRLVYARYPEYATDTKRPDLKIRRKSNGSNKPI